MKYRTKDQEIDALENEVESLEAERNALRAELEAVKALLIDIKNHGLSDQGHVDDLDSLDRRIEEVIKQLKKAEAE